MTRIRLSLALAILLPAGGGVAQDYSQQGPEELKDPEAWGVGRLVPDFSYVDAAGRKGTLVGLLRDAKLVVFAFSASDCPVSKLYRPRIERLAARYGERGVRFVYVYCDPDDRPKVSKALYRTLHDKRGDLTERFHATRTTDAFVVDPGRILRYRGAIDDQYGIGYRKDKPKRRFLCDALDSLLAGNRAKVRATRAPGCPIQRDLKPKANATVTFHRDVEPIIQKNCQACHRTGEIAPFPLMTYAQARKSARRIKEAVKTRVMPPWFANPKHGTWANDRRLSKRQIKTISRWVDDGCPKGDVKDAPKPRKFTSGWQIGKPDLIVRLKRPVRVRAEGVIPYRYYTVKTRLKQDRWVNGIEIRAGAREVVHHVLVFVLSPDQGVRDLDEFQWGLNGYFGVMVPGEEPMVYPDGFGKLLPAGSRIVFQIHYTPVGTELMDQTMVGFKYATKPVKHVIKTRSVYSESLSIPPGAANHRESAVHRFRKDSLLFSLMPHMHLRGKSFRYTAIYPGGKEEILLDVPRYDFNWQLKYRFQKPKLMPKGTRIRADAVFDNSKENPANPDPTKTVHFGEQTFEEMLIGYMNFVEIER